MNNKKNKNINNRYLSGKLERYRYDIIFAIALIAIALIHLSRIRLGMAHVDESFYLSIPYRLLNGDSLLTNEWHVAQLAGFVVYPFIKVYFTLFHSTEGIFLAFRYIYLFVHLMVTVSGYFLLRNPRGGVWR